MVFNRIFYWGFKIDVERIKRLAMANKKGGKYSAP